MRLAIYTLLESIELCYKVSFLRISDLEAVLPSDLAVGLSELDFLGVLKPTGDVAESEVVGISPAYLLLRRRLTASTLFTAKVV